MARIDALLEEVESSAVALRDAEIRFARAVAELEELGGWQSMGCAGVGELGERFGIAADEARTLLGFGRTLRLAPHVEGEVRAGRIPVGSAACVGEILADPTLQRPEDDWIGWAQTESTRSLRRRLRLRREEVRLGGEVPVVLTLFVREAAREGFGRARMIASRKAGRALTEGETFETVVDHYLDDFDPDRVTPGARRSPPTSDVAGRYVPMAVRREVYARQGERCAVPFCDHQMFLEKAHLVAHASGGDREADNLLLLCSLHHTLFDGGRLRVEGTAREPRFFDGVGRDLARRIELETTGPPREERPAGDAASPRREASPEDGSGPSDGAPPPPAPPFDDDDPPFPGEPLESLDD